MYLIEPIRNGSMLQTEQYLLQLQVLCATKMYFLDDDILFPYYCDPKVEIGKFQNTVAEVNEQYFKRT